MVLSRTVRKVTIPIAKRSLKGVAAEKFVEKMLRTLMRVPSSERALLWREFLLKQPVYLRKTFISIRSRRARIRKEIKVGVVSAINEVRRKFPEFKGLLFFGSLAEAREKGNRSFDLDVIPIVYGTRSNVLSPDAYELLSKRILSKTQIEVDGLKTYVSHKGTLRETLFSIDINSPTEAKKQLALIKRSGFSRPGKVFFASYNFFGDEEVRRVLEKIVD